MKEECHFAGSHRHAALGADSDCAEAFLDELTARMSPQVRRTQITEDFA
jgi:hypothetical protein